MRRTRADREARADGRRSIALGVVLVIVVPGATSCEATLDERCLGGPCGPASIEPPPSLGQTAEGLRTAGPLRPAALVRLRPVAHKFHAALAARP